jgi:hypothetical protein
MSDAKLLAHFRARDGSILNALTFNGKRELIGMTFARDPHDASKMVSARTTYTLRIPAEIIDIIGVYDAVIYEMSSTVKRRSTSLSESESDDSRKGQGPGTISKKSPRWKNQNKS